MRFSSHAAALAAVASAATATPHGPLGVGLGLPNLPKGPAGVELDQPKGLGLFKPVHAGINLNADLSGKILAAGTIADLVVDPILGAHAEAEVSVVCEDCHIKGDIDATISLEKLVPALKLSLKDIEVLLDLDVHIGAAATIAVNLVAPVKVELPCPGLKVEALVALDLILGVHTELDVSAGVYLSLPEAELETDILSGDILSTNFDGGVVVKVLPIKVRIGCTELLADLRLRVDLGVAALVDVDDVLPLDELIPGFHLPTIGAGLELAVFVNLLEYVGLFCDAPECPLVKESYGLNVGAEVELDVDVENLLDLHLAPTVALELLNIPTTTICIPSVTPTATGSTTSAGPSDTTTSASSGPSTTPTSSGPGSSTSSGPVSSGSPTSGGPGSTGPGNGYPTPSAGFPVTTAAPTGGEGGVTSTIVSTGTYTVTACALNVANCPSGYQTSVTLVHTTSYTTVCPITASGSATALPTTTPAGHGIQTITKHVTTMVPCSSATTIVPPTNFPTAPYPGASATTPAGYPGSAPSASYPAGGYPSGTPSGSPSASYPVGGYPSGSPSASYPAGGYPSGTPSASYPAGGYPSGSQSASYPAGGYPSSYPAVSSSSSAPAVTPYPTGPAGGYPTGSAGGYPADPAGGNNGTVPATWTTSAVSSPAPYPTGGYPTAIPTGAAGKAAGSMIVAVIGAIMAL